VSPLNTQPKEPTTESTQIKNKNDSPNSRFTPRGKPEPTGSSTGPAKRNVSTGGAGDYLTEGGGQTERGGPPTGCLLTYSPPYLLKREKRKRKSMKKGKQQRPRGKKKFEAKKGRRNPTQWEESGEGPCTRSLRSDQKTNVLAT